MPILYDCVVANLEASDALVIKTCVVMKTSDAEEATAGGHDKQLPSATPRPAEICIHQRVIPVVRFLGKLGSQEVADPDGGSKFTWKLRWSSMVVASASFPAASGKLGGERAGVDRSKAHSRSAATKPSGGVSKKAAHHHKNEPTVQLHHPTSGKRRTRGGRPWLGLTCVQR